MVIIDEALSRGLVRAETRELTQALKNNTGAVLETFHKVIPTFKKGGRLSLNEMFALARNLDREAKAAFSPLWSDMETVPPTKGRPQAGSYEMVHYWVNPRDVEGTSHRLMKLAVFSAWGDRKEVCMRAHDTLVSFYEHASQRLLQRCGSREAAVRAIGERLVETLIIPSLALTESPPSLPGMEISIPFMGGLLIGRFVERPADAYAGDYKRIWREGWRTWQVSFPATAEFVVKTYIGPEEMRDRQHWIAYEVNSWLAAHRDAAETIRRYVTYKLGSLWDNGHMTHAAFEELRADYWRMSDRVFGPVPVQGNTG